MTWFEPRTSGIGSNCSTNCATPNCIPILFHPNYTTWWLVVLGSVTCSLVLQIIFRANWYILKWVYLCVSVLTWRYRNWMLLIELTTSRCVHNRSCVNATVTVRVSFNKLKWIFFAKFPCKMWARLNRDFKSWKSNQPPPLCGDFLC